MGKKEYYEIPVLVGDQLTTVSLKIVRGKEKKGFLDIAFDSNKFGQIRAQIQATKEGLTAEMQADSKEGQSAMEEVLDEMNQTYETPEESVQTTQLYQIAKSFLQQLGKVSAKKSR